MKPLLRTLCLALVIACWFPTSNAIAEPYIAPFTPSVRQIILAEATFYSIPPEKMIRVAKCESTFNPKAYNPKDVDGRPKYGLYQFDRDTFNFYAPKSGIEKLDIWDAQQQAHTTAYMLSIKKDQWGCR